MKLKRIVQSELKRNSALFNDFFFFLLQPNIMFYWQLMFTLFFGLALLGTILSTFWINDGFFFPLILIGFLFYKRLKSVIWCYKQQKLNKVLG